MDLRASILVINIPINRAQKTNHMAISLSVATRKR